MNALNGSAPGGDGAMAEMEALMRAIAAGAQPDRGEATAYSRCRAELLAHPGDAPLPGFLHQCLTVFRFRDFITLFDPDPAARESFVVRAFDRCRAAPVDMRPTPIAGAAGPARRWQF